MEVTTGGAIDLFGRKRLNQRPPLDKGGTGGIALKYRPYKRSLKPVSRKLRKKMTDAERKLWSHLRRKQILQIQFHTQKGIGPYVVDFYAPAANLVVEIDGSQHLEEENVAADAERDLFLKKQGLTILRFDNRQVLIETESVLSEIFRVCEERRIPPVPPLSRGGRRGC